MDQLPAKRPEPPEIIEPEIIGPGETFPGPGILNAGQPAPWWRRALARFAIGVILAGIGLALILVGLILTVTVLGAFIGIPLMAVGLLVALAAIFLPFGPMKIVSVRWPPRQDSPRNYRDRYDELSD